MPRGTEDTFHRFLWITLVAVAFTFTVILTSVFVDIDDLLAKRTPVLKQQFVTEAARTDLPSGFVGDLQEFPSSEEDTEENESTFRTKRSLESNNYLLKIKSPKMKKILTDRLATLVEELDEEESSKAANVDGVDHIHMKDKYNVKPKYLSTEENEKKTESIVNTKDTNLKNEIEHKDVLHLAMHNILLQGIIGHMDINEVYKKVHSLIKSFETNADHDVEEINNSMLNKSKPTELMKIVSHDSYKEEDTFFNELMKCEKLQKQILRSQEIKIADQKELPKDSQMVIKTTIEIINNNNERENVKKLKENTTGTVKLVYNGKEIKATDMTDDKSIQIKAAQGIQNENNHLETKYVNKNEGMGRQNNNSDLDQAIAEYLKTHSVKFHNKYNVMTKGRFIAKRLKRQIKIHYVDDQVTTEKSKRLKEKSKHHEDELYVEIETHFDGKGSKGEKKKKLVRTLIDKIQKAINSNVEVFDQDKTFQQKHLQIKKRMQNPIEHNELIVNTISPIGIIEHRQLNPISKTANEIQQLTSLLDKSGDTWKKVYDGPGFLTASKSLNSAEMRELDIDYNSVLENGIPKRLQKPINTENEDLLKLNEYSNMGNVTLFLKDINGSGFSIGINQYTDEPPDKDTLKMFTGLENLIQAYHEHYDQTGAVSNESDEQIQFHYIPDIPHEIKRRDVKSQKTINKQWFAAHRNMNKGEAKEKNLFYFTRSSPYKRSAINVKRLSNIKSKTKLNKFINTNPMSTKKIFHKSKRNKRQLDKIRIIASDHYPATSREDVFFVSRENFYADRAIEKEEAPEVEIGDLSKEHYDVIAPYSFNMDTPNLHPAYLSSTYNTQSLHTGLMSKYPHIFLENISRSKDFINISPSNTIEEKSYQNLNTKSTMHAVNGDESNEKNISSTNVDEIVNAILPSRKNFKLVVKIFPKNNTVLGPGFKEVHTLINKSYDKNGVRYISSLNVTELSKFESLNKTKEENQPTLNKSGSEQQNQIKLLLELLKQRIDQQLEHLKVERKTINQLMEHENSNKNISHLFDIITQIGLRSSYGKNYLSLNDNNIDKHVTAISNTLLVKSETTTQSLFTTMKEEDPEKMKIMSSIKETKNITRTILQKIDNNTNLLQLFLQKLLDEKKSASPEVVNTDEKLTNHIPKHLEGAQVVPLLHQLHTNFTNTIPFIYAFQHPLTEYKNKAAKTVANLVYHGHIHADKVNNDGKSNDFLKSVTNNLKIENNARLNNNGEGRGNETRFFIDELENDFKVMSNVNNRVPVLNTVKKNTKV